MQTTYRFRLDPNQAQSEMLARWQKHCCYVSNRMLGDREQTYHNQCVLGDYCSLYNHHTYIVTALRCNVEGGYIENGLQCSVNRFVSLGGAWRTGDVRRSRPNLRKQKAGERPSIRRSAYEMQSSFLPILKQQKPELEEVSAFVLQKCCSRVDEAFKNFFSGKGGYPNYKSPHEMSFEFSSEGVKVDLETNRVSLTSLGSVRFFNSREWWDGLKIRKTTVTQYSGHWYINILVRDDLIPNQPTIERDQVETVIGGDIGIKKLLSLPGSATFDNPQFSKQEERKMRIRQRRVSRKKMGSNNRKKATRRVGKLHATIANRRNDYQWKVAKSFVEMADMNVLEDLKVSNIKKRCKPKQDPETGKYLKNSQTAKSGLNRAINDAAWYNQRQKIAHQSHKQGKLHVVVPPQYTSQECRACHHISKANRAGEKFICEVCGHHDDADNNAGGNIADRGIQQEGLDTSKVRVVSPEFTPKITARRYHCPLGLVSRGIVESKPDNQAKKRMLGRVISLDTQAEASSQSG